MTTWNGYGSSKTKCVYCGKLTTDYLVFQQGSINIEVYAHWECRKEIDLSNVKHIMKELTKEIK